MATKKAAKKSSKSTKKAGKQISEHERVRESSKKDDEARPPVNSQQDHVAPNLAGSDAARELQNPHLPPPQGIAKDPEVDDDGRTVRRSLNRGSVVFLPGDAEFRTPITIEEDVRISYDGMGSDRRFVGMLVLDPSGVNFQKNIGQVKGTWSALNGQAIKEGDEGIDMGSPRRAVDEEGEDMGPVERRTGDEVGEDLGKPVRSEGVSVGA
jgi:hypothetical protein